MYLTPCHFPSHSQQQAYTETEVLLIGEKKIIWWEKWTSEDEDSETQLPFSVSGDAKLPSSFKTGKPCPIIHDNWVRLT